MRQLRRSATALAAITAAILAITGLAGCAAPAYTYAADSGDHAYFKVPSSWPEVSSTALAAAQSQLSGSEAGPAGGTFTWSRAYSAANAPAASRLLAGATEPVVYASVQTLKSTLRGELSFDDMRDLLLPVTSQARSTAEQSGFDLTGFQSIGSTTINDPDGVRGINELFEYDIGGQPDAFEQTVLTNSSTTKLYLLLVQCYQACFVAHETQIKQVVDSFTVRGS
jgi:hypothetical protein